MSVYEPATSAIFPKCSSKPKAWRAGSRCLVQGDPQPGQRCLTASCPYISTGQLSKCKVLQGWRSTQCGVGAYGGHQHEWGGELISDPWGISCSISTITSNRDEILRWARTPSSYKSSQGSMNKALSVLIPHRPAASQSECTKWNFTSL